MVPPCWKKVYETQNGVIESGLCIVIERDGRIVASAGLMEAAPWYSAGQVLGDFWFYILPGFRGAGVFSELMRACQQVADDKGLPLILSVSSEERAAAKVRLFGQYGMKQFGGSFIYRGDQHVS